MLLWPAFQHQAPPEALQRKDIVISTNLPSQINDPLSPNYDTPRKSKLDASKNLKFSEVIDLCSEDKEIKQETLEEIIHRYSDDEDVKQEGLHEDSGVEDFVAIDAVTGSENSTSVSSIAFGDNLVLPKPQNIEIVDCTEAPDRERYNSDQNLNHGQKGRKRLSHVQNGGSSKRPKVSKHKIANTHTLGRSNLFTDQPQTFTSDQIAALVGNQNRNILSENITAFKKAVDEYFVFWEVQLEHKVRDVTKQDFIEARKQFHGRSITPNQDRSSGGHWHLKGMKTNLHHHQFFGVAQMRRREKTEELPRGGFLSDEVGFGKTAAMLANILDGRNDSAEAKTGTTLIVVKSGLLNQWYSEIEKHLEENLADEVGMVGPGYQIPGNNPMRWMSKHRIIITTYEEVRKSYPKDVPMPESPNLQEELEYHQTRESEMGNMHKFPFWRVVLDEAQDIKNHKSMISRACRALQGKIFWVISATPLQNDIQEAFPYLAFLREPCASSLETFKDKFLPKDDDPVSADPPLKRYLDNIMIRRTHQTTIFHQPVVYIPRMTQRIQRVLLSKEEKTCYKQLNAWVKKKVGMLKKQVALPLATDKGADNQSLENAKKQALAIILFLRMFTSHPLLVSQILSDKVSNLDLPALIRALRPEGQTFRPREVQKMTGLIEGLVKKSKKRMDEIRRLEKRTSTLKKKNVPSEDDKDRLQELGKELAAVQRKKPEKYRTKKWLDAGGKILVSPKLRQAVELIEEWHADAPEEKFIVFSQYIEVLHILEAICKENKWGCRLLYGAMSLTQRDNALQTFKEDPKVFVLAASLKCGGVGLNITAATRMITLDLWWNEAVEQQAFGRVYRMGQTKETEVVRLVANETIDEAILDIQDRKSKEIESVMSGRRPPRKGYSWNDLVELVGGLDDVDNFSENVDDSDEAEDEETWFEELMAQCGNYSPDVANPTNSLSDDENLQFDDLDSLFVS